MIDEEARALMERYAGRDFDKPRIVTHEPFSSWGFHDEWTLDNYIAMINKIREEIPAEFRKTAIVSMADQGYDSGTKFSISYEGPESPKTVNERVRRCEEYVLEKRREERREYEYLKKKFES